MKKLIGFIGQGFIGKNYADDFENRGYEVIRYSLEWPYRQNRDRIKDCDVVFIAVPTPTTPQGFDDSIVRDAVKMIGYGKVAIIKSTIVPGTTESIQAENPDIFVIHSPEFLTRHTATYDAANPDRNIIGIPYENDEYRRIAEFILSILPRAPYELVCQAKDAEFVKYGGNSFFYFKNIFFNLFYDLSKEYGANWNLVREAIASDPRIGDTHTEPINKGGRGAGGDCLIKDFETLLRLYRDGVGHNEGIKILESLRNMNIELLMTSGKDLDLVKGVYGDLVKKYE